MATGIRVKRHPELTPWRHQELTPWLAVDGAAAPAERVVHGVHRGDPRIATPTSLTERCAGVPVDPRGRAAVKDCNTVLNPGQSRAAVRC